MNLQATTHDATDELLAVIDQLREDDRISAYEQDAYGDDVLNIRHTILELIKRHNDV